MLQSLALSRTATPLLNRERCPAYVVEPAWVDWVSGIYVSMLLVWGELIVFTVHPPWKVAVAWTLSIAGNFLIGVVVHELGHLLASKAVGHRFVQICVAGVHYSKTKEGRACYFMWDRHEPIGFVVSQPRNQRHLLLRAFFSVIAGPIATLLLVTVAYHYRTTMIGASGLMTGIFLSLGSCFPFSRGLHCSDAKVALTILRGGPAAQRLSAMLYVMTCNDPVNPGEWPPEIVRHLHLDVADTTWEDFLLALRYMYSVSCGPTAPVAATLERRLELSPYMTKERRYQLFVDAARFHASHNHDLALARQWMLEALELLTRR